MIIRLICVVPALARNSFSVSSASLAIPNDTSSDSASAPGMCDVRSDGAMCLGSKVILPAAVPAGLVAFYSFDEASPLDQSGNSNHPVGGYEPGPPAGGGGASAAFRSGAFLTIAHRPEMASPDFAYSGWVFLTKNNPSPTTKWCPVFRKGIEDGASHQYANAPALLLDEATRHLKVVLSTDSSDMNGEFIESNARLRYNQWYHFAVVRVNSSKRTRLYVNGILDVTAKTAGSVKLNDLPLYIGGDPWSNCNVPMLIDEFRVYSRPLTPDEIAAEASPSLGGVEPHFVRLSCVNCGLKQAIKGCPSNYHLCNSQELQTAAYGVARTMGWIQSKEQWVCRKCQNSKKPDCKVCGWDTAHIWTHGAADDSSVTGLGLCCGDS